MEPTLTSERLTLRALTASDLPVFQDWYSDPDVRYWLHMSEMTPITREVVQHRFGVSRTGRKIDAARLNWVLDVRGQGSIGEVGLVGVDPVHGRAELRISLGEKACWGKGYGVEAMQLVLRYSFDTLRLRRVWLITDADNTRGLRAFTKCGFRREGILRGHRLREGKAIDMVVMACLQVA